MRSNTHLWERVNEEIDDFNCICTGINPGRRSPAESQCETRRVPGDKCAVLYINEDCDDDGSLLEEGWGTINPAPYMNPKSIVVRPGCKLVTMSSQ